MIRGTLRWGDGVIAGLAILSIAAAFGFIGSLDTGQGAHTLVITQAGTTPRHEALNTTREIELIGPAGITRVLIEPGRARCAESPGRRNLCENSGWLERHGDLAVSLPNRLTLQVLGHAPGFDSIHY